MAESVVNTYDIDRTAYAQEQALFLQDQAAFRTGNVGAGVYALGHLKSMYYLLWYRKHQRTNKSSSDKFISLLKVAETDTFQYAKNHKNDQAAETIFKTGFRELVATFDLLTERYQQIIIESEAKP